MKNYIVSILVLIVSLSWGTAQVIEEQGVGQLIYKGMFDVRTSDKQEALLKARLNALQKYVSTFEASKLTEYSRVRSMVERNIDRFVPTANILDEEVDKKAKTYTVVVRAQIGAGLINQEIAKTSAVQNVSKSDRSFLTFIFLSRKAVSVKQYDDKVTKRVDTTRSEETIETQAVDAGTVAVSGETYTSDSVTSGGSTEIKSDKIDYNVSSSDDINTTVMKVFGNAGYEVLEAEMVADETDGQMKLEAFVSDFSQGEDVSAKTRKGAANGCRDLDIRYLAIGKLDIGQNMRDPVSGMIRVYVNVNAKVYDVSERFPKTVSSVGPVQYSGMGPTQDVAQRNALQVAGKKAASDLVSQMSAKRLY